MQYADEHNLVKIDGIPLRLYRILNFDSSVPSFSKLTKNYANSFIFLIKERRQQMLKTLNPITLITTR